MKSFPRPTEVLWLYLGILGVVMVVAIARYAWIVSARIPMNMPPSAMILTAPLLAAELLVGTVLIELILRRFDGDTRPRWHLLAIGASYCSVMAFSWSVLAGVIVTLFVNPITVRFALGAWERGRANEKDADF